MSRFKWGGKWFGVHKEFLTDKDIPILLHIRVRDMVDNQRDGTQINNNTELWEKRMLRHTMYLHMARS